MFVNVPLHANRTNLACLAGMLHMLEQSQLADLDHDIQTLNQTALRFILKLLYNCQVLYVIE